MVDAIRDNNHVPVSLGVSSTDDTATLPFKIDSATGRLLTNSASGSGDVVGPASAVDNEIVLFDSTTGKLIKSATLTGLVKASSGVIAQAVAGTDYLTPSGDGSSLTGITASQIAIALGGGSPTVDQVQEYINNTGSAGWFEGGEITDGGSGTIDVAAGSGFIRTTNDANSELQSFKWSASAGIAVTDNTTQYVYVDDSGVISLSADEFLEAPDKIQIGVATDEGGVIIHEFSLGVRLEESVASAGRFMRHVHGIQRNNRLGGLIMGQSGDANRDVTMTAGELEWGRSTYTITSKDTSGADTFFTYSASGQEDATASQWPNAQYDNAGTLTTMSNNKWANLFFWLEPDDHLVMVYGRSQFNTEGEADNEGVPSSSLPTRVTETGFLIARFTFQKSANTATISSAFEQLFANAAVTDHGDLAGLTDDDHTQYALLAGRSGGQTLIGGTDASDDLVLASTSNGTKGTIRMGDATTGLFYDEVNGRLSINSSENTVTVGGVTIGAAVLIHGIDDTSLELALHQHSDSATMGAALDIARSRGTEGSETVVQDNDRLGSIFALGHDGTDYEQAALIAIEVDGTPGAGDMPGRIVFSTTPDGSATPAEAMRISNDKIVALKGNLDLAASTDLTFASTAILSDSAGVMTLSNIDALDATTESTIEAAIDTLANLVSIQGLTVTLADAGADAILGWDDTAGAYENLSQAEVLAVIGSSSVTAQGVVELATTAEIDTGTDSTRAIPVDQFVASKRNIRWLVFNLVEAGTDVATATNIAGDFVSPIAGTILQSDTTPFYLYATNSTAGTTGTMVVDISIGGTTIMTTNKLDFDSTEKTTTTATTPPDLTTTALAVGDIITIDIDSIHTTAAKGLTVYMAIRE